ncbi:MAG: AAA family ATPase, partial [Chloroflexota bacterium]
AEKIEQSLHEYVNACIKIFLMRYEKLINRKVEIVPHNALLSVKSLVSVMDLSPHKLYLFIDEYDNFANEVFMQPIDKLNDPEWLQKSVAQQQKYNRLVTGESLFKTLLKAVKTAASGIGLDRVFMTGVSPTVLNDATSGPNTFKDVTWRYNLNDLCGFNEAEVEWMLGEVIRTCEFAESKTLSQEMLKQMRTFYDGSRFATQMPHKRTEEIPRVYNPTLTFYFLEEFQDMCTYPEEMLDSNLASDRNKLEYLTAHQQGRKLLLDALHEDSHPLTLADIDDEDIEELVTVSTLRRRFGMKELSKDNHQRESMATLLTYLGVLTVSGKTPGGSIRLTIPNLVIRQLYAERALQMMSKEDTTLLTQAMTASEILFERANLQPLCTFIEQHLLAVFDNRDYREFDELTLKTIFISMLYYKNIYIMDSEPAIIQQYGDLLMMLRPGMRDMGLYDFLFEFKFLKLKQVIVDGAPLKGAEVAGKSMAELLAIESIKDEMESAKKQLRQYRQGLQHKYGAALKLRTFAVVGVGLKRVIWEPV